MDSKEAIVVHPQKTNLLLVTKKLDNSFLHQNQSYEQRSVDLFEYILVYLRQKMKQFLLTLLASVFVFSIGPSAIGQESETKVIDEVVAQVNEGVITLSRVKRESKGVVDSYVQEGKKREEAQKMIDEKQGELIANLINEELLIQKAKELGLDSEVDASLNQRFLQIMKQYNLKTLDALHAEMEKQGVDPQEIREVWRKQAIRDLVLQREVQSKIYWQQNGQDLKNYFEKNKARFTKPETITISEIFLSFAGRDETVVRDKAKQLVAQLRGGADFIKTVMENSDRPNASESKGKVDTLNVKDLDEKFGKALANVKVGGVTDPIEIDQVGINILRVDERTQASSESHFDENAIRMAITQEKAPAAQKEFMAKLRQDSYIKISDTYRPLVSPILFAEERKDKTEKTAEAKPENK
jgi:peptidyl-prolyl cis-trans isomerase SurA